jgi:hypothetical protein
LRCSPPKFVLAALAFIVSAVLALPMLLVRKAEAGAPPQLEALSDAGWARAADDARAATGFLLHGADSDDSTCSTAHSNICAPSHLLDAGAHAAPLPVLSASPSALSRGRLERLLFIAASATEAPWPDPHTIDRQRRYHLRP